MSYEQLVAVIIGWFTMLQPVEKSPERAVYYGQEVAAIAKASLANPVFGTPLRTAAVATATVFFESGFDPNALGDCDKGKPRSVQTCRSYGAFQINKNYAKQDVLLDAMLSAPLALRLMGISKRVCRDKEPNYALGHYAAGGAGCRGLTESMHRMALASRLEKTVIQ